MADRGIVYDELGNDTLLRYPLRRPNDDIERLNKLYFVRTWVDVVTSEPANFVASNIDTPEKLAWAISVVNGLNGATAAPTTSFTITKDIDMSDYIWVPIVGTATHPYSGTFEGNGHVVTGIHSPLSVSNKGIFGITDGAHIQNLQAEASFYYGIADTLGGIVANMKNTELINCEQAGYLESNQGVIGGLAGKASEGSIIHSSFAVDTLRGNSTGVLLAGLVGENKSSDLLNSYSILKVDTLSVAEHIGGLVGINKGTVENCYMQLDDTVKSTANTRFGWLAYRTDEGTLRYCYIPSTWIEYYNYDHGRFNYVVYGAPAGHGTYGPVKQRKAIGYMYDDNEVSLVTANSNPHVSNGISYPNSSRHDMRWPGMLSALNEWVKAKNASGGDYTVWFRPITDSINGDLPVLGFPKNAAMGTLDANGLVLRYSGLDTLLTEYRNKHASIFLYGNAINVQHVPTAYEKVSVNENSVLLQDASAGDFINATVGVTFDNSNRHAHDYFNNTLTYDWHLMSTPLRNAKVGAEYGHKNSSTNEYTPATEQYYQNSPVDLVRMNDGYFPNGLPLGYNLPVDSVRWDFFSYYEPEYHWINLKRNKNNHFHFESIEDEYLDKPYQLDANLGFPFRHYQINYTGTDQADYWGQDATCVFTPGKGYMMAISQESYLNSTGILNRGDVIIPITAVANNHYIDVSADRGSNLVGNPYQAYLDLDEVSTSTINTGLDKFWVYDADVMEGAAHGLYKPYTKGVSINPALPSRFIHPHQAFFVVYEPGTSGLDATDMTFKYYMATADTTKYSHYRGDEEPQPTYPLVNLYMKDSQGNADMAIVEFNRPETGGVKKTDNLRNADFTMYAKFDGENYGLLFTPVDTERVPVFFKTPNNDTYTLSWDKINGSDDFEVMRLIDNITGADYDMLTHDHYTFEGRATDFAARFYIVFSTPSPEEPEPNEPGNDDDDNDIFAINTGNGWLINGTGQLELVDMLGRVLYTKHLDGKPTMVHFDDFAAATYMLRLVDNKKILKTQKIVIY